MKVLKRVSALAMLTCLCLNSMNMTAFASSVPEYEVEETINNGMRVWTIGNGDAYTREEKEAISEDFSPEKPAICSYDVVSDSDTGLAPSNKNAHCDTYMKTVWDVDRSIVMTATGETKATWYGEGEWDECVFNQTTTVNSLDIGLDISVYPPGISIDIDGAKGITYWESEPIEDDWEAKAERGEIVAESMIWISSVIAEDSADIYIDNTVYRPSTYIKIEKP